MCGESCTDCEYASYAMCSLGNELCNVGEVRHDERVLDYTFSPVDKEITQKSTVEESRK